MMEKLIAGAKRLGLELTARQTEQFETYFRELVDWNQRMNLTAITGYEEVQVKHFLDSLTVTMALGSEPGHGLQEYTNISVPPHLNPLPQGERRLRAETPVDGEGAESVKAGSGPLPSRERRLRAETPVDGEGAESVKAGSGPLPSRERGLKTKTPIDGGARSVKAFSQPSTSLPSIISRSGMRVIDVGTGAGLPGIPLKIIWPDIQLTLLEATRKKAVFLEDLKAKLGLDDIEIVNGRAEDVAHRAEYREKFDVVVSRAVAALPALLELTLPFCAIGGVFVAQKEVEAKPEMRQAARVVDVLEGRLREVIDIGLAELPGRCLIVFDKMSSTPPRYPRRPGVPAKNPIV